MTIGEAARESRRKKGISIKELSAKTGIHQNTIIDFEKDRIDAKISTVEILADGLEMRIDEYIGHFWQDKFYKKKQKNKK